MATRSRVVETSFRFGSGRYVQESGAAKRLPAELTRLHATRPFIFGGKTALSLACPTVEAALQAADMPYSIHEYTGFCCVQTCEELMSTPAFAAADAVVGIGGGNVCDAAKYMAVKSDRPVILIPTSSATCACFTPLSVTYTKDFRRAGSFHHDREVNGVLADMDFLCQQPERLLAAGVYDAAAKLIEIEQRVRDIPEDEVDVGLNASYALSRHTYERMFALMPEAVKALEKQESSSKALYDLVYLAVAATGVISGMARGSNQCAVAHKIYDLSRELFPAPIKDFLHGEIVAIGLLAQLYYNGRADEIEAFAADMRSHGLPTSLPLIGIEPSEANKALLYDRLLASTAMAGTNEEEHERLTRALAVIW